MTMTRDDLVDRCLAAEGAPEVIDILRQAAREGLDPDGDDPFAEWHRSEGLTVQRLLWPPGFEVMPHDHGGVWAAVAVLSGVEENHWFRPVGERLVPAGGRAFGEGEIVSMGPEAVHTIRNPRKHEWTMTVHVYGGDLQANPRRAWEGDDYTCVPLDPDKIAATFYDAVSAARRSTS